MADSQRSRVSTVCQELVFQSDYRANRSGSIEKDVTKRPSKKGSQEGIVKRMGSDRCVLTEKK